MLELNLHGLDTYAEKKKIPETLTLSQNKVSSSNMSAKCFSGCILSKNGIKLNATKKFNKNISASKWN